MVCACLGGLSATAQIQTNAGVQYLQCMQKDMSTDFYDLSNTYFLADSLVSFDVAKGEGLVQWKRYRMSPRQAFNLNGYWPVRMQMLESEDQDRVGDAQDGEDPDADDACGAEKYGSGGCDVLRWI